MTVPPLLVIGNANVDLVLGEVDGWPEIGTEIVVERSEMRAGGSAGNSALALTGLGQTYRFVASTGSDPNGTWLRDRFEAGTCDWIVEKGATTVTVGIVHKGGDRVFFTTPGHLQKTHLESFLERIPAAPEGTACALISGGFQMPALEAGTERLLRVLADKGWRTAIDPGWPPRGWTAETKALTAAWLDLADIALLNAQETCALTDVDDTEGAARALIGQMRPDQQLVIKDGVRGAFLYGAGRTRHAPAPAVRVIDSVGAGDTFNGAFLASLVQGNSPEDVLAYAVEVAARAISSYPRSYAVGTA